MIEYLLSAIEHLVTAYGAAGIFVGALIEEVISFIPSAAVIMFAGFFTLGGTAVSGSSLIKLFTHVTIPVSLGLTIGSLFVYGIVYYLGKPAIVRFGKYFGVSWKEIEIIRGYIKKNIADDIILFLIRATPVVPFVAANAFCGLVRWPFPNYLLATFLGALVRGTAVGFIGWQLGSLYKTHATLFNQAENVFLALIALALAAFVFYRRRRTTSA